MRAFQAVQPSGHGRLGRSLEDRIERREDRRAAGPQVDPGRRAHVIEEVRRRRRHGRRPAHAGGLGERRVEHSPVDRPELVHLPEHDVAPPSGTLGVLGRRVAVRGADHAGEKSALGGGQPARVLAEVTLGGRSHAMNRRAPVLAEVHGVQIGLEDLLLRIPALDGQGQDTLTDLPAPGAIRPQDEVLDELLRQRAGALDDLAPRCVHHEGAPHGDQIHAPVLEEPVILRRQHRQREEARHVSQRQRAPAFRARLIDAGEQLRLELQGTRRARDPSDLDDSRALDAQTHAQSGARTVSSGAEVNLPTLTRPAKLAWPHRLARYFPVGQAIQAFGDRLDSDSRRNPSPRGVDERRPLGSLEVETCRRQAAQTGTPAVAATAPAKRITAMPRAPSGARRHASRPARRIRLRSRQRAAQTARHRKPGGVIVPPASFGSTRSRTARGSRPQTPVPRACRGPTHASRHLLLIA